MMKSLKNWNWKKHAEFIATALSCSLLGWFALSFLNTNAHNLSDYNFADWNLFYCYSYQVSIPHYVFWMMLFFALAVYFCWTNIDITFRYILREHTCNHYL